MQLTQTTFVLITPQDYSITSELHHDDDDDDVDIVAIIVAHGILIKSSRMFHLSIVNILYGYLF
jgi:hypothetical protein